MATSILQRKKDLVYLIFFVVHLPVMLAFDLTAYYPINIKPLWMLEVRKWYISTYNDHFFTNPPPFFPLYTLLELLFHLPLTIWAIPALVSNHPKLPLALLVFALETSITTLTCMAEMLSWDDLTSEQRGVQGLGGMYGAYLAVGVFMAVDSWMRLERVVGRGTGVSRGKKSV